MIIIGAGSLGHALAKHTNFERSGFKIIGIFDIKNELLGEKINDIEIMHLDSLQDFFKDNPVDIAVLTVPENRAVEVAKTVTGLGIKKLCGISRRWNLLHQRMSLLKIFI
jgi:redox-sensing transcriptional repressor